MNKILKMIFILVLTSSSLAFAGITEVEKCLQEENPNWIISEGKTNGEEGIINGYVSGGVSILHIHLKMINIWKGAQIFGLLNGFV